MNITTRRKNEYKIYRLGNDEQEKRENSFLDNCYERAFVIYSYDKNLHLAHLENSNMPLKDFLRSYKVKMRELDVDEVIYHI